MNFELGKYYRHSGGCSLFICGAVVTLIHGMCLIGEGPTGSLTPVGSDETAAVNWEETSFDDWKNLKRAPGPETETNATVSTTVDKEE